MVILDDSGARNARVSQILRAARGGGTQGEAGPWLSLSFLRTPLTHKVTLCIVGPLCCSQSGCYWDMQAPLGEAAGPPLLLQWWCCW